MASDPAGDRPAEDLTARARIRDAALRLFAERGIGAATIRDIAAAAGVSSGLVRHHFGSKEALRDACDAYAVDRMNRWREEIFTGGRIADQGFFGTIHPAVMLLQSYLVQSMMDGSPAAAAMFDDAVGTAERWLAARGVDSPDPRAHAAVMCAMQMGVFLMRDQLSRVLGVDVATPEGHLRMNRGFVDAAAHPLLSPEEAAQLHAAIDAALTRSRRR